MASGSGVWAEALKTDADDKSRASAAFRTIGIIKSMVLSPERPTPLSANYAIGLTGLSETLSETAEARLADTAEVLKGDTPKTKSRKPSETGNYLLPRNGATTSRVSLLGTTGTISNVMPR